MPKKLTTQKQIVWYQTLIKKAYQVSFKRDPFNMPNFDNWKREMNLKHTQCYSVKQMERIGDFDVMMLELAIIADDVDQIAHFVSNAERRIRWVIEKQFIPDLEFLLKEPLSLSYIKGIAQQAGFPTEFMDCPARDQVRILQMVDTHIRRLAKREGIELIDLPSGYFRRGVRPANAARAKYRHDHHHHVHHDHAGKVVAA